MGSPLMSPMAQYNPDSQPQQAQNPAASLLGQDPNAMSPSIVQQAQAQIGALEQLRTVELNIGGISQQIQQMAAVYPAAAQQAQQAMQALDVARQAVISFLLPVMSNMPEIQPQGPAYMGT